MSWIGCGDCRRYRATRPMEYGLCRGRGLASYGAKVFEDQPACLWFSDRFEGKTPESAVKPATATVPRAPKMGKSP